MIRLLMVAAVVVQVTLGQEGTMGPEDGTMLPTDSDADTDFPSGTMVSSTMDPSDMTSDALVLPPIFGIPPVDFPPIGFPTEASSSVLTMVPTFLSEQVLDGQTESPTEMSTDQLLEPPEMESTPTPSPVQLPALPPLYFPPNFFPTASTEPSDEPEITTMPTSNVDLPDADGSPIVETVLPTDAASSSESSTMFPTGADGTVGTLSPTGAGTVGTLAPTGAGTVGTLAPTGAGTVGTLAPTDAGPVEAFTIAPTEGETGEGSTETVSSTVPETVPPTDQGSAIIDSSTMTPTDSTPVQATVLPSDEGTSGEASATMIPTADATDGGSLESSSSSSSSSSSKYESDEFDDSDWNELPEDVRQAYEILGWDENSWDNGLDDQVESESLDWEELSPTQREAAIFLGYTQESWDSGKRKLLRWRSGTNN